MKFLLNVAEVAQAIRVMSRSSKFHSGAYPISFIHKLFLSSKCTSVTFYDNVTKFTVDETEALIQVQVFLTFFVLKYMICSFFIILKGNCLSRLK